MTIKPQVLHPFQDPGVQTEPRQVTGVLDPKNTFIYNLYKHGQRSESKAPRTFEVLGANRSGGGLFLSIVYHGL